MINELRDSNKMEYLERKDPDSGSLSSAWVEKFYNIDMDKNLEDRDFFDKAMRLLSNDMRDIVFLKIYWRVKFEVIAYKRKSTIDKVKKKY